MRATELPVKSIDECIEGLILEGPTNLEQILELEDYKERKLYVGPVYAGMAQEIVMSILKYNEDDKNLRVEFRKPIRIYINSGGGGLEACFSIIDAIETSETPVHTYNTGAAYSAGGIIFMAGHKRFTFRRSSFLLHEGSSEFSADAGKFKDFTRFYEKQLGVMEDFVLAQTKITKELFERKRHSDWWMDAEEMIHYGIADEIITKE